MLEIVRVMAALFLVHSSSASALNPETKESKHTPNLPPRPILVTADQLKEETYQKLKQRKPLSHSERQEIALAEIVKYKELRDSGVDEVSNTPESAMLRSYRLRDKKRRGFFRKKETSLSSVLFPGVSPEDYADNEQMWIYADVVNSRKTQVPYEYYDLMTCPPPHESRAVTKIREKRKVGSGLQSHHWKPAQFQIFVKQNKECTVLCHVTLEGNNLRWMRRLIERHYRVQLSLDSLPVLIRNKEYNYAVRGYPVGFKRPRWPDQFLLRDESDVYIYNHLKFTINYHEDPGQFDGIRITGFDVLPVSIVHDIPVEPINSQTKLSTCQGFNMENDPATYLKLGFDDSNSLDIVYSYDVQWISSQVEWSDRWDVYLLSTPNDDIHYSSIVTSLMIVLVMSGAITTIMIRTLRKDIAGYNELQTIEEAQNETGWKLVHGDIFRPPSYSPMVLSVLVGTGVQIGCSCVFVLMMDILSITNLKKGQVLTLFVLWYILNGSMAGYISSQIYRFSEAKDWKFNALMTAVALPGAFVVIFSFLNICLSFAGAATTVSFLTIVVHFLLWVFVSAPLVFAGAFFGLKTHAIEASTTTNQNSRTVPGNAWHMNTILTALMGGVLPFGSVSIELSFIMSFLWLNQLHYATEFLMTVLAIVVITCAQVSTVFCYLQLCAEDHRWWWTSFWNCATAGIYLFVYSLWFLIFRLNLVGILSVMVYLIYMGMISICFGLFCGSVGFLSSFWFTRTIYSAVKVD